MKTKKKLQTICVLLSILIICSFACFLPACAEKTPVTGISLNKTTLTIMERQTFKLVATVEPDDATDKKVKWSVTQTANFVSVSEDGTVTALTTGIAVVTAKIGKISADCNVIVVPLAPTAIELDIKSIVLDRNESYKLNATIKPIGAPGTVAFASDNPAIATVDPYDGTVTAKSTGETVVKAYVGSYDGAVTAECKVRVGYKVTVQKQGNGNVSYTNNCYYSGSSVSLTATPNKGYKLEGWYENGTRLSTANPYSYKVAGDATITAKFVEDPDAPKKNAQGYYEIKTNKHLVWVSEYPNDKYVLKNNLTADSSFEGFEDFGGIFDGSGYTITGFKTDSGFFASISGTVKNLTLKNADSSGNNSKAGILAGKATTGATIENCHVQGSINVGYINGYYDAGGLLGSASNAVIKKCSADVTVSINSSNSGDFGGLIGHISDSQISNCSAKVNTKITFNNTAYKVEYFGGLIGNAYNSKVDYCWSDIDADVTVNRSYQDDFAFGGLIGYSNSQNTFANGYATGSITVKIPENNGNNEYGIAIGGAFGYTWANVDKFYSAVDIDLSGESSLKSGSFIGGFCGNNSGTISNSVYCGQFTASGAVASRALPFSSSTRTTSDYYVSDRIYFESPDKSTKTILSSSLNNNFFKYTLNFGDSWKFDNDNSLPHF